MSGPPPGRECARADGQPKRRYLMRADAKRALRSGGKRLKGQCVYACSLCGYWHIGHRPADLSERRARRAAS